MRATFKRFCSITVLCVSFKLHIVKVRVIRLRRYGSKERSVHIYVHLRSSVHVQLKYKKNYILLISWKSLFSSLNRDDWYIFCTRCLCVSISFTFYCYSIILMASLAFFRGKQCTLLTTLEMGKINKQLTSTFLGILITWKCPVENAVACVASISVWLQSKERPRKGKKGMKDTQLGSHCSDTLYLSLSLFQCCFVMAFWWTCPSSRPTLKGAGKRRSSTTCQHPSIDPSFNVTDCSS